MQSAVLSSDQDYFNSFNEQYTNIGHLILFIKWHLPATETIQSPVFMISSLNSSEKFLDLHYKIYIKNILTDLNAIKRLWSPMRASKCGNSRMLSTATGMPSNSDYNTI